MEVLLTILVPGSSHIPASKTHWATRFLQPLLSSAASSTSSQLMPIFLRSFSTSSFQFCRGRPGLLLKPSGSPVRACRRSLLWYIHERCPSHLRRLHLIMSSSFGSAVASLTFSFVTLSFQEIHRILRCHLWCSALSFSSVWMRLVDKTLKKLLSPSILIFLCETDSDNNNSTFW